jgi:hypothetical protein
VLAAAVGARDARLDQRMRHRLAIHGVGAVHPPIATVDRYGRVVFEANTAFE